MMPFHPVKPVRGGKPLDEFFQRLASSSDWVCQAKMDGQRALWVPDSPAPGGGRGVLWSRRELPITRAHDIVKALSTVTSLIDGELIMGTTPKYWAFDLPYHEGDLEERWDSLTEVVSQINHPHVSLCPTGVTWEEVNLNGWEGVVFKRKGSKYVKGHSPDKTTGSWIKYRAEWL